MNQEYAVIDIETNGGRLSEAKITEVSIFIFDGNQVLDEFTSLVNPQVPIPSFITQLTGIDDEMVKNAPLFSEIADQIWSLTEGRIFIAHNVGFDFGIIREEFRRIGIDYQRPQLCSVKLARKYLPGHRSYGLGNLCADLGISIHGRHRAKGDAEATVEVLKLVAQKNKGLLSMDSETWQENLPEVLDPEIVRNLPRAAGLLQLFNKDDDLIYSKPCKNIYQSAAALIASDKELNKEMMLETVRIEGVVTGNLLVASLIQEQTLHQSPPLHLQKASKKKKFVLLPEQVLFGNIKFRVTPTQGQFLSYDQKSKAEQQLKKLFLKYNLCALSCQHPKALCLTCKNQPCFGESIGRPNDMETAYQMIADVYFKHSDFVMIDKGRNEGEVGFVLIENHRLRGYGFIEKDSQSITQIEEWSHFIQKGSDAYNGSCIVWKFINDRNYPTKIIPLEKQVVS